MTGRKPGKSIQSFRTENGLSCIQKTSTEKALPGIREATGDDGHSGTLGKDLCKAPAQALAHPQPDRPGLLF
jgi:hypothetical protein